MTKTISSYYYSIGGILLALTLQSCFVFSWLEKARAKADGCCNFQTDSNKVNFNCANSRIIFLRISVASNEPGVPGSTFYESGYSPPVNQITIPELPGSIKQNREVIIDIWKSDQVIQDYSITVKPEDWLSSKTIFSHYSYR